ILARIFLKPSELQWDKMPAPDCDEMVIKAKVKGGTGIYEYSIDNGKNFFPSESGELSIPIEREGDYYLQVSDGENLLTETLTVPCSFKKVVEKDPCLENKVKAKATGYRETAADAADGRIKVKMKGGCPPYNIYLNGKSVKSGIDANVFTIKALAPGGYKIRVESKLKENYLDIPNKIYVAKYKAPAPKISNKIFEDRINKYISGGFDYEARVKIQRWFADENTSVNSSMIDLSDEQSKMTIDLYLSRLKYQNDIIKAVEITAITFDDNNDIKTYSVNEIPK
ncbi:MAG: hypothetical protein U9R19_10515, partial [Bacteroidota bacterium]|nr:hypothetical protein [Bacteroidota bacterium]